MKGYKDYVLRIRIPENYENEEDLKDWLAKNALAMLMENIEFTLEVDGKLIDIDINFSVSESPDQLGLNFKKGKPS
jgi:hypothetical protein